MHTKSNLQSVGLCSFLGLLIRHVTDVWCLNFVHHLFKTSISLVTLERLTNQKILDDCYCSEYRDNKSTPLLTKQNTDMECLKPRLGFDFQLSDNYNQANGRILAFTTSSLSYVTIRGSEESTNPATRCTAIVKAKFDNYYLIIRAGIAHFEMQSIEIKIEKQMIVVITVCPAGTARAQKLMQLEQCQRNCAKTYEFNCIKLGLINHNNLAVIDFLICGGNDRLIDYLEHNFAQECLKISNTMIEDREADISGAYLCNIKAFGKIWKLVSGEIAIFGFVIIKFVCISQGALRPPFLGAPDIALTLNVIYDNKALYKNCAEDTFLRKNGIIDFKDDNSML
ncbi:hypothetical protein EGR_09102 [Echinococcus granulosus]|uniref:Uncharacterized protein n=1 Tax=Echinococcus granulosus TaxID=6210 RepID=W6UCL9_ECHGR|nr:hypothetical protein EGR_09102 [Echinococcus granulosus]EUB56022.1 hypothetical protein EGR_09102 [Echinococcus granulosus]